MGSTVSGPNCRYRSVIYLTWCPNCTLLLGYQMKLNESYRWRYCQTIHSAPRSILYNKRKIFIHCVHYAFHWFSFECCDVNCQTVGPVPAWTQRITKYGWNIVHKACIGTKFIARPRIRRNRRCVGKRRLVPCAFVWKPNPSERTNLFIRYRNNL